MTVIELFSSNIKPLSSNMPTGIVQFFLEKRGFGYIQIPVTKEEFYVQRRHLLSPIADKDKVHFVVKENKKGLFAAEVRRLDE